MLCTVLNISIGQGTTGTSMHACLVKIEGFLGTAREEKPEITIQRLTSVFTPETLEDRNVQLCEVATDPIR